MKNHSNPLSRIKNPKIGHLEYPWAATKALEMTVDTMNKNLLLKVLIESMTGKLLLI